MHEFSVLGYLLVGDVVRVRVGSVRASCVQEREGAAYTENGLDARVRMQVNLKSDEGVIG